jgi:hypothetical protein
MKKAKSKVSRPRRTHRVLGGSITKVLKAFGLKMKDLPQSVPYLVENGLDLPERLSSKAVRQIGASAIIYDTNGFSLGDILLWVDTTPDAPITFEAFLVMVYKADVGERSVFSRKSVSRTYRLAERVKLSWEHHDRARRKDIPQKERLKLLHQAVTEGWSSPEVGRRANSRLAELTSDETKRPLIHALVAFEQFGMSGKRILRLLAKQKVSEKEHTYLVNEGPGVLKMLYETIEVLSHSPIPPLK